VEGLQVKRKRSRRDGGGGEGGGEGGGCVRSGCC